MKKLIKQISDFKNRNILVIGDIIVDINTATKVIGFSAETPTIKAEELQSDVSMGGAGINMSVNVNENTNQQHVQQTNTCLLYTSPSPRD